MLAYQHFGLESGLTCTCLDPPPPPVKLHHHSRKNTRTYSLSQVWSSWQGLIIWIHNCWVCIVHTEFPVLSSGSLSAQASSTGSGCCSAGALPGHYSDSFITACPGSWITACSGSSIMHTPPHMTVTVTVTVSVTSWEAVAVTLNKTANTTSGWLGYVICYITYILCYVPPLLHNKTMQHIYNMLHDKIWYFGPLLNVPKYVIWPQKMLYIYIYIIINIYQWI